MRKKDILAYALDKTSLLSLMSKMSYRTRGNLIVLAYHRVLRDKPDSEYLYDEELVSASVEQFEQQMKYISGKYTPISEEQVIDCIDNKKNLPKNAVLVTFDDGFDDNYHYAFPILKKYNIPATVFISTDYIGTDNVFWFDWLASLIYSSQTNIIEIPLLDKKYIRGDRRENKEIMADLIIALREVSNDKRLKILSDLISKYEDSMSYIDTSLSHPLNWDQVREMSKHGINFGSHTVSHPILSRLSDKELLFEIEESKVKIEKELNKTVNSISYPTGMQDSFSRKAIEKVKEAGYRLGFTYIHEENKAPIKDRFMIGRYHIETHVNNEFFKSMLIFPNIFKG